VEDFKLDQKQMDELKQQMELVRKNFNVEDFKFDQKQMDELKRQMEELRKTLPEKFNKELDQLNQMEAPGVAGR
jgi:hypothetical protein